MPKLMTVKVIDFNRHRKDGVRSRKKSLKRTVP